MNSINRIDDPPISGEYLPPNFDTLPDNHMNKITDPVSSKFNTNTLSGMELGIGMPQPCSGLTLEEVLSELGLSSYTEMAQKAVSISRSGQWGAVPRGQRRTRSISYTFPDGRVLTGTASDDMGYITALTYAWQ